MKMAPINTGAYINCDYGDSFVINTLNYHDGLLSLNYSSNNFFNGLKKIAFTTTASKSEWPLDKNSYTWYIIDKEYGKVTPMFAISKEAIDKPTSGKSYNPEMRDPSDSHTRLSNCKLVN